ncbi:hypothetical protein M2128_001275 [Polynucleobacter sphagniphilus]|uniref:AIPR family protein n=1 Tax=Polynucleobacter sphagniphilus TaxID=1743169 RepID=UPI0024770A5A|nr:AIPR family protein [Polynucleobacter sphagniphilus]MDH6302354.1 hypothetical protein [Polynucleobacter sphagniphilus]
MNNDQIILDQIIEEQRAARVPSLKTSDFFEIYVAEQLLKNYDLSDEEIEFGLVGSGLDGGLDGIYTFANGELVRDDFDPSSLKKNVLIEVVIFQSKTSDGFREEAINKLIAATQHLFSLATPLSEFAGRYNESVLSCAEIYRSLYQGIASKFPEIHFHYIYATRGDGSEVHPNVKAKANDLEREVKSLFKTAKFAFSFYGSSDLLNLARQEPKTSFQINFSEILTGDGGYIALVKLKDFIKFLRDEKGLLRKSLFDSNVRDYQGRTQVNEEMQKTLGSKNDDEDFWWLNNGVTVVAGNATQAGKVLTIEDPQIVNGQQTSTEIYNYFQGADFEQEGRSVMLRVIVATESQIRDRIIKATNSQTTIPAASLRATEKIHRDIEAFLAPYGLYYDRRKNYQKQAGRPVDSIISIGLLAQAVMAIILLRPDDARARPSSLIKHDEDYEKIFNTDLPIKIYLFAAKLVKACQAYLRSREDLDPKDRNNLLFYILVYVTSSLTNKGVPTSSDIELIDLSNITEALIKSGLVEVEAIYTSLGANEKIAKGPQMLEALKKVLASKFPSVSIGG